MKKEQEQVREFMRKAGQLTPESPELAELDVAELRLKLHKEEACNEFSEGVGLCSLTLIGDSIADALVVVLGTACAYGIEIEPIFQEVMRSNMTKFIDGHRRNDGKWIKGPSYTPANIAPLIELQKRGAA